MDGASVMVINPVYHNRLIPVLVIVVLACIMIYQIVRIIITVKRRKKLYKAAGMVIDGHDKLLAERKIVTIDGEALTNSFVRNEIEKNNAKIEKIRKKVHPEAEQEEIKPEPKPETVPAGAKKAKGNVAAAEAKKAAKEKLKKQKGQKMDKEKAAENILNSMYSEDDIFYDALSAYYEARMPEITDPTVRSKVIKKKKSSKKTKPVSKLDTSNYSVFE